MSSSTTFPTISSTSTLSTLRTSTSTSPTTTIPALPSVSCDLAALEPSPFPDTRLPYVYGGALYLTQGWVECCDYGSPAFFYNGCNEICILSNLTGHGTAHQVFDDFLDCAGYINGLVNQTNVTSDGSGLANEGMRLGASSTSATLGLVVVLASMWGML